MNGNNTLVGDADTMVGMAHGGDDVLIGGIGGTNTLIGEAVTAGGGPPTGSNDRLVSADRTPDDMWGDFKNPGPPGNPTFGNDTFVFRPHNGEDVIRDFHPGEDIIEIDSTTKAKNFPNTFADLTINQVDTNGDTIPDSSVIHFGLHDSVTVLGVTNLGAADFTFVV